MDNVSSRSSAPETEVSVRKRAARPPSRKTNRGLATLAVFLGVLLLVELTLRILEPSLLAPLDWPHDTMQAKYRQMVTLGENGKDINVAFVGSSVVFDGIDPLALSQASPQDIVVYNSGVAGGVSTRAWRWWTTKIVVPHLRPEMVVIGLASIDLNANNPDDFWLRLSRSRGFARVEAGTEGGLLERLEDDIEKNLALFRLRTVLRDPLRLVLNFGDQIEEELAVGPFGRAPERRLEPYDLPPEMASRLRNTYFRSYEADGTPLNELQSLVRDLKAAGIEVVLVNMPVTDDHVSLLPNGEVDYSTYVDTVQSLAQQENVEFLDFGRHFASIEFFRDETHLNPSGAAAFSSLLATSLPEISR